MQQQISTVLCLSIVLGCTAAMSMAQTALPVFPGEQLSVWASDPTNDHRDAAPSLADIDGDGILDLALTQHTKQEIHVFHGDGLGGFSPIATLPVSGFATDVEFADLDGDSLPDLVATTFRGAPVNQARLEWAKGLGNGSFAAFSNSIALTLGPSHELSLALADVDHDNDFDAVVCAGIGTMNVEVLLGNGSGGFTTPVPYSMSDSPSCIALADLNGDTHPDIAVACAGASSNLGTVTVRFGNGIGGFGPPMPVVSSLDISISLGAADLDQDGDIDLVTGDGSFPSPRLVVALNSGNGTFVTNATSFPSLKLDGFVGDVTLEDFDGDGLRDVALPVRSAGATGGILTLHGNGSGAFLNPRASRVSDEPRRVATGDLDRDGKADLVMGAWSHTALVFLGGGPAGLRLLEYRETGLAPQGLAIADLNADGALDVAVACQGSDQVWVHFGDGQGGLSAGTSLACQSQTYAVAAGHLDSNGLVDLVAVNAVGNSLSILLNQGGGNFAAAVNVPTGATPNGVALGDVTGDGNLDAIAACIGGTLAVHAGNGSGGFGPPVTLSSASGCCAVLAADLDGDGDIDLVAANSGVGSVSLRRNLGAGNFAPSVFLPCGDQPVDLQAADLDGNGRLDLVVCNSGESSVSRMLSSGPATFGAAVATSVGRHPTSMAVADFNGDSRVDIAVNHDLGRPPTSLWFLHNTGGGLLRDSGRRFGVGRVASGVSRAGDFDGDGRPDVVFAGRDGLSRVGVLLNQTRKAAVSVYCTGKFNSVGCVPAISATGVSSASATSGFLVAATYVSPSKPGLLLYGVNGRAAIPFQAGTLCIVPPIHRSVGRNSGGSPASVFNCTGAFVIDLNAFAAGQLGGNPLPLLSLSGTVVDTQWWGRDPGFPVPNNSTLSNALEYIVGI